MTPRKADSFIPEVAREENLPLEIVENIISFYWKEVRQVLTSLGEKRIMLMSFGTFEARWTILTKMLNKYTRLSENSKVMTYTRHAILEVNLKKLTAIKDLLLSFEKEKQRHRLIKDKRNAGNI